MCKTARQCLCRMATTRLSAAAENCDNARCGLTFCRTQVLLCAEAEVDATHFIDSIANKVIGVDHTALTAVGDDVTDREFSESNEEHR